MTDPEQPGDPQRPGDPEGGPYPQYPAASERIQPAPNPRPIRASRVWVGIGLAFLGHVVAIALAIGLAAASVAGGADSFAGFSLPLAELLVLVACIAAGSVQLSRGDRGLGVGLLIGWAVSAVIFAGACVALVLVVANSFGG